ncbi:membrane zinc transporter [Emericellopsis atlantica]|uniref:Membrane zinc transporter n=1 Tax=Emericellopsis atlantica TaxID=2614577 RepID=A0A9P7ZIQ8_9HYPO|nr:membrane zinc transporter [Emericellopsis atlantica]KAG9252228.1 membrane zinc transporter [Emericellopsis atlantica]
MSLAEMSAATILNRAEEEGCDGDAADVGHRALRIASIFIILVSSGIGALMPIFLAHQSKIPVPKLVFFICKYFGTGVIIATAWMHLLEPAADALGDPCLTPRLGDYPWAFAIGLWTVMAMFFVELMAMRSVDHTDALEAGGLDAKNDPALDILDFSRTEPKKTSVNEDVENGTVADSAHDSALPGRDGDMSYPPGGHDHLAHRHEHTEGDSHGNLAGQLTSIFILEFGVLFHSIFIGLTLGTTDEVTILLIVLVFHQMFEGLGLGSRLAIAPWPKDKKWLPYLLATLFALSTPIGIAAGIGAQPKNANDQKLVNGIFDAISAGILMYTGLVELLAHEFMFNPHMRRASLKVQLFAFSCVLLGMGLMALLAKWA